MPRLTMTSAMDSAACTAFFAKSRPTAAITMIGPRTQNRTDSPPLIAPPRCARSAIRVALCREFARSWPHAPRDRSDATGLVPRTRGHALDLGSAGDAAGPVLARGPLTAARLDPRLLLRRGLGDEPVVVVLLGRARDHRVRGLDHARLQRREQVLLLVDESRPAGAGELVLVRHGERPGRARLDAEPAEDAAQVVDLVDAAVALTGRESVPVGVVRALDVDGVGRAGPGAQLAADALLQPVRVPVELVAAVVARLGGDLDLGVLLGHHTREHGRERDAEARDLVAVPGALPVVVLLAPFVAGLLSHRAPPRCESPLPPTRSRRRR